MMLPPTPHPTVPVSGIVLVQPDGDLVESNSSIRLSCSSSGSSLSFLWLNGSSEVAVSDRVHVADGGSTLIINVTRFDQGPFRCHVFNPVSNGTSDPVSLTINCELITCIFAIFMLQRKRTFPFDIFIQMVRKIPLCSLQPNITKLGPTLPCPARPSPCPLHFLAGLGMETSCLRLDRNSCSITSRRIRVETTAARPLIRRL